MNAPRLHPVLEERLRDATRQWRNDGFLRGLAMVIAVSSAAVLALGVVAWRGWLTHPVVWIGLLALAGLLAGVAGVVLFVAVRVTGRPRRALAALVERVNPGLLDALNTLVFLERRRDPEVDPFRRRVERQAVRAVAGAFLSPLFPRHLRRRRWLVAAAAVAATASFYAWTRPWDRLAFSAPEMAEAARPGAELDLNRPDASPAEVTQAWGEVRITEPGRDLKVTKVDVVALQIEAAANGKLSRANWSTAVGGGPRQERRLPEPREPHHAVYRPVLYLDELRLADWDVVSYYATAATSEGPTYTSEIYFLEVRPFREDILKLPGGEQGNAYRMLSELSGLVDRQKHVLRQTHAFEQRTYTDPATRRQDRDTLAGEEKALDAAARHLYGQIAAKMENQDVAVVLDHLAKASEWLDKSAQALSRDAPAVPSEQEALTALVATRKRLQKAITDDPSALGDGDRGDDDEKSPTAELPDKLKQIAEYRNEQRAVQEALDRAAREQKTVEADAKSARAPKDDLAAREERLAQEIEELARAHPRPFKGTDAERRAAQEALSKAAEALREGRGTSRGEAARAGDALDDLRQAVERRTGAEQLGQAYALRDALEERAQELGGQAEKAGEGSAEAVRDATEGARDASRELQRLLEEPPVGDSFGPELKKSLAPPRQGPRERALDDAARSAAGPASPERRRALESARRALEEVTGAFDRSAPEMVRKLRGEDPLKEAPLDAFARALRQLEGLADDPRGAARPSGPLDRKQREDALAELHRGADALYGRDARLRKVIVEIEQALKDGKVDGPRLKKLLETIERFRVELGDRAAGGPTKPELRHLDPSKLPPGYRERIERYFQKLSEQ